MVESKAAASEAPAHILPREGTMTTKTMQADCDLEVPSDEVQPQRIPMNPKLLKAMRSGDKSILDKLLQSEDVTSRASMGEITITVPEDIVAQNDARCLFGVTLEGNTALHIVASRGHLELATEICHRERSLLMTPNTMLDTPLHCAARAGDDKMVSLIIEFARKNEIEVRKVLMARNWDEANALHEAAKYDHLHVAKLLIEEDVKLASMLNDADMSPLYLAIAMGSLNVAKALLQSSSWEKASPASYKGPSKQTALHVAIRINREITQDILDREPMLAKAVDSSGRIPLHYAALHGNRDVVKLLLERDPSTAHLSDADGFFPIHFAAMKGNFPAIDEILEQCPDTDELLDRRGRNFLHVAFQCENLDVVKKIISKRADLWKLLNDQDSEGNTSLHTAVENGDQWSMHFLLRNKTVHVNVINHRGLTPLDLAYSKCDEVLQFRTNAAEVYIASCLAFTKAWFSSQKLRDLESGELSSNEAKVKLSRIESKEIGRQVGLARNLGIATVLIATVTFAAGFTVPGGYIADDHLGRGSAVLAKEYAFKVFLVSDAFGLVCSIVATCSLMYAGTSIVHPHTRKWALVWSVSCLWVAFVGMSTAFAMGIYAVLAPSCKSIGILVCIITLGAPFYSYMVTSSNHYSLLKTVRIRQGYRQCIWPNIHPHVKKRLGYNLLQYIHPIIDLLLILGAYAIFFLSAML